MKKLTNFMKLCRSANKRLDQLDDELVDLALQIEDLELTPYGSGYTTLDMLLERTENVLSRRQEIHDRIEMLSMLERKLKQPRNLKSKKVKA